PTATPTIAERGTGITANAVLTGITTGPDQRLWFAEVSKVGVTDVAYLNGDVVITGTSGNDAVTLKRTAGGTTGDITFNRNGGTDVVVTGATTVTFNGLAGADTFTIDSVNGLPLL